MSDDDKRVIRRSRLRLIMDPRAVFFSVLSMRLKILLDPSQPTAATDGHHLFVNTQWFKSLTEGEQDGIIVHEVMHVALKHPWRRGNRDRKRWNVACDLSINSLIRRAGFLLPDGGLFPDHFGMPDGRSAEWYYREVTEAAHRQQRRRREQQEAGEDEGPAQATQSPSEPGETEGGQDKQSKGRGRSEPRDRSETPGTVDDLADLIDQAEQDDVAGCGGVIDGDPQEEREVEQAVREAGMIAKGRGTVPGQILAEIEAAAAPKQDWRQVLRHLIEEAAANDYEWIPPDRRFIGMGLYLPGMHSLELGDIVIAIDTSGSMSDEAVGQCLAEIQAIFESGYELKAVIMQHDHKVQAVTEWRTGDPIPWPGMKIRGRGGTSHEPVFKHIQSLDIDPKVIICLSDMMTTYPDHGPDCAVIWAAVDAYSQYRSTPPFGDVVKVTEL